MQFNTVSDSPSWTKVFQITDELSSLSDMVEKRYPALEWELSVCMRCLPRNLGRKTFSRYYAQEKMLALDIALDEENFLPVKKNKAAQRKLVGTAFFTFFVESIKKYEKKLPNLQSVSAQLVSDIHEWCIEGEWID